MDEVMQRIQSAVAADQVETLTMTVGTQRRAVLEAVAYGTFLRDVETRVDTEYHLLTPLPPPKLPPRGWSGEDGGDGPVGPSGGPSKPDAPTGDGVGFL